ncbi:MAG: YggT family protein [Salaquimonas sp.]
MVAVFWLINTVLDMAWWLVILSVVFSWLYAFNVVNSSNQFIAQFGNFLYQITEPLFRPIRKILPNMGNLDLSPIIVLLGITFLQVLLRTSIAPMFGVMRF